MSHQNNEGKKTTVAHIRQRKNGIPLVALTAYTAPFARLADSVADILLVGDSLGMVLYGLPSTVGVTLEMMIAHGQAVVSASDHACVIVDMPFATYQESPQAAFRNASRILSETGCAGVKLEGGLEMAPTISFLVKRGIPIMAHIGLMPQSINALGGYFVQGRTPTSVENILSDARAVVEAGAFSLLIEATVESVAKQITKAVAVPTIGIGASIECDGQILVSEDILGLTPDSLPIFVKRYGNLSQIISDCFVRYADDVRNKRFPESHHCYIEPTQKV